jgi:hypothetical protein
MGAPPTVPPDQPAPAPDQPASFAEALESRLVGTRAIHFVTHRVQPPAALYVTSDDGIYLSISNLQPNLQLTITATLLLPDGRVQANAWNISPPSTGTATAYLFPLYEAFMLNVSLMPASPLRYGAAWCFVAVRRGGMASGINLQTLIADYLDAYSGPTWPGSRIRHTAEEPGLILTSYTATLASGVNFIFTVPSYARMLLRGITCQFVSSATVGNRYLALMLTDPALNAAYVDTTDASFAANNTVVIGWGLMRGGFQTAFANGWMSRSLPEIYLLPGAQIQLNMNPSLAGDHLQAITLYYEQWFTT